MQDRQIIHFFTQITCLICVFITLSLPVFSEELSDKDRIMKLNDIELKMADISQRRSELQKAIAQKNLPEEEKEELTQRLQMLSLQNREFITLFEQTVLGGIDISLFNEPKTDPNATNLANDNWQREILIILQPYFAEMQRATEKTKQIDLLHEEKKELIRKVELAKTGLKTLEGIDEKALNPQSQKLLAKIQDEWSDRLKSLEHQENIVDLKLLDLTDTRHFLKKFTDNLWLFIRNEGLALLLAFSISITVYYIFSQLIMLFTRYQRRDKTRVLNFKWRLTLLTLH